MRTIPLPTNSRARLSLRSRDASILEKHKTLRLACSRIESASGRCVCSRNRRVESRKRSRGLVLQILDSNRLMSSMPHKRETILNSMFDIHLRCLAFLNIFSFSVAFVRARTAVGEKTRSLEDPCRVRVEYDIQLAVGAGEHGTSQTRTG